MSTDVIGEYFDALERIRTGRPTVVNKGVKITNDSVAIEAGRSKGSLKKSRPQFSVLLSAIREAAAEQMRTQHTEVMHLQKKQQNIDSLKKQLDAALARENSLVIELYELRLKLAQISGERVLPLRRRAETEPRK